MDNSVSVIIPAFNEAIRIFKTLNEIDNYISNKTSLIKEVIVVDDGSTDNTKELVKNWIQNESKNKEVFKVEGYSSNKGKGYAIYQGLLKANADLILYTDADGASPIDEIEKFMPWVNEGFDIIVGSRVLKDNTSIVTMSKLRRLFGWCFHLTLLFLGLADFKDTQCGFKLFRSTAAKKIAGLQKCFNYSFDIEYLFLAKRLGYKVKEVPINWYHVKGSKINLILDSIKMLIEVIKIRFIYNYN